MTMVRHFTAVGRLLPVALSALIVVPCVGCGPGHAPPSAPVPNQDSSVLSGAEVQVWQAAHLPTLQLLRRKGDPKDALGISVFTGGRSQDSLALSALLTARLRKLSLATITRVTSAAVLVVIQVPHEQPVKDLLEQVHQALHQKVSAEEIPPLELPAQLAQLKKQLAAPRSEIGECEAELGAEGLARWSMPKADALPTWVEEIRARAVVASHVGISAVGSGPLLDELRRLHQLSWSAGTPLDDSWSPGLRASVRHSEAARELRVALRVSDSERALAAGRALRETEHPLLHRLRGHSGRFSVADVRVTLRPAGACLSVTLDIDGSTPPLEQIASAALLVAEELHAATSQSLTQEERSLALIEPQTAVEAAALAAWSAVRSPVTGAGAAQLIEYTDRGAAASSAELMRQLSTIEQDWQKRTLPLLTQDETGQAELYVMLASSCGMRGEIPALSGLRALTVSALAEQFSEQRGVTLLPFIHPSGVGLIAHSARMNGETHLEQAARVGRVLAGAFSGTPVDGREVARARSAQLLRVGSDPGLSMVHSVFGGDHQSLLEPYGNDNVLSVISTADVERSREELAQEPLRLAVLSTAGPDQAKTVQAAVERWLASERQHPAPCAHAELSPAAPGQWTVETLEENVQPGALIAAHALVRPEVGHALIYHLTQHPELLRPALPGPLSAPGPSVATTRAALPSEPPWPGQWEAHFQGYDAGGVLFIRVTAPDAQLSAQVEQMRISLHRLSQT
ncbi:MAG TPA: hypothetical protein VN764_06890, partial [Polyangiaceae bacterium]|nr:hypothetical protein [Polyangiaceae bacterium]